jgi:hypothetical protein
MADLHAGPPALMVLELVVWKFMFGETRTTV